MIGFRQVNISVVSLLSQNHPKLGQSYLRYRYFIFLGSNQHSSTPLTNSYNCTYAIRPLILHCSYLCSICTLFLSTRSTISLRTYLPKSRTSFSSMLRLSCQTSFLPLSTRFLPRYILYFPIILLTASSLVDFLIGFLRPVTIRTNKNQSMSSYFSAELQIACQMLSLVKASSVIPAKWSTISAMAQQLRYATLKSALILACSFNEQLLNEDDPRYRLTLSGNWVEAFGGWRGRQRCSSVRVSFSCSFCIINQYELYFNGIHRVHQRQRQAEAGSQDEDSAHTASHRSYPEEISHHPAVWKLAGPVDRDMVPAPPRLKHIRPQIPRALPLVIAHNLLQLPGLRAPPQILPLNPQELHNPESVDAGLQQGTLPGLPILALITNDTRYYPQRICFINIAEMNSSDCLKDFVTISVIGKGTYAKVLLVRQIKDGGLYALKVLKKKYILEKKQERHIMTEKQILSAIEHPFLVKMKMSFQDEKKLYFLLEYCPGGELFGLMAAKERFTEDQAKFYAAQIVLALEALHKHKVIYRDLKPQNVIIDKHGYIKLTDFGLSKILQNEESATSICGTPEYLAPEIIKKIGHGTDVDWWCLACLIHEMICGFPPFRSQNRMELFEAIVYKSPELHQTTPKLQDLLKKMLHKDPMKRLGHHSAKEIKEHPWFAELHWDNLLQRKIKPPFMPKLASDIDTRNFGNEFTSCSVDSEGDRQPIKTEEDKFKDFSYE